MAICEVIVHVGHSNGEAGFGARVAALAWVQMLATQTGAAPSTRAILRGVRVEWRR